MSRRSVSIAKPRIAFPLDHSVDDQSYESTGESSGKFADGSTAKAKSRETRQAFDVAVCDELIDGDFHSSIASPVVPRDSPRIVIQVNLKSPFASVSRCVRIVT